MSEITIAYEKPQEDKVIETAKRKALAVIGESFIVDWSTPGYEVAKGHFGELTQRFCSLFKSDFTSQKHLHSTILSKRLDRTVDLDAEQGGWWKDSSFSETRTCFESHLSSFVLSLDSLRLAGAGTVQLVLRDNIALPRIRMHLKHLGASVKAGTIKGDFVNTCTVVLGYFSQVPKKMPAKKNIQSLFENWCQHFPREGLQVHTVSLVRYFDLSLDKYVNIQRF
jgi:hypothetical protein